MNDASDALAALERAAKRRDDEKRGNEAVRGARTRLIMGRDAKSAFFASLAIKQDLLPDWNTKTFMTNGRRIRYNPTYAVSLTGPEILFVVAHEVCHTAFRHHVRMGARDPELSQIAADLAINGILVKEGFTPPAGVLMPGKGKYAKVPFGLAFEEIYNLLKQPPQSGNGPPPPPEGGGAGASGAGGQQPGDGEGEGAGQGGGEGEGGGGGQSPLPDEDPGGCGGFEAPGSGSQAELAEEESRVLMHLATAERLAKQRGSLPAGIDRLVGEALRPKADQWDVLREFLTRTTQSEYRWSPPNRRFIHQNLYLPSRTGEELGDIVLALDESGSVGEDDMRIVAGATEQILDTYKVRVHILHHDTAVHHVQQWESDQGPLVLEPKGGGGTDHNCVFEWIAEQGMEPVAVICLTDLYTRFPQTEPDYPVLWAVIGDNNKVAPFGQTLKVEV